MPQAKNLDDLPAIVSQIQAAGRSSAAPIMISNFEFTCDTMSGSVKPVLRQEGRIHYALGAEVMESYSYQIQIALEIAAKMDLIEKIKSLNDTRLNAAAIKHTPGPDNLSEVSVNHALTSIIREVDLPLIVKFGLMAPVQTREQQVFHAAIKKMGADQITTYAHVDQIWSDVEKGLSHKMPTPNTHQL